MRAVSPRFKWIVIDSPPIVPVADALALARHADASLLVVRAGRTPCEAVEEAFEALGAKHVMGVVLNGVEGLEQLYSKYNSYYRSSAAIRKHSAKPIGNKSTARRPTGSGCADNSSKCL